MLHLKIKLPRRSALDISLAHRAMSQKSPFNHRPKLHLAVTSLSGSPLNSVQNSPSGTPFLSPYAQPKTPFATPNYSPFRSAGLRPPTPYGGPVQFNPRRPKSSYGSYTWFRVKRVLGSKAVWIVVTLLSLLWWWSNGGRGDLEAMKEAMKVKSSGMGMDLLNSDITKGLQFFPASNPKIHVGYAPKLYRDSQLTSRSILADGRRHRTDYAKMEHSLVNTPEKRLLDH